MKKTYIAPTFLLVKISCSKATLTVTSFNKYETGGNNEVLVKEENTYITDKSLWDEEW